MQHVHGLYLVVV